MQHPAIVVLKGLGCSTKKQSRLAAAPAGQQAPCGHSLMKVQPSRTLPTIQHFAEGAVLAGKQKGVTGKSESMKGHLQKCENVSDKIRAWAKDWSKDSEPFADDTADSPEASAPRQSGMQRFLPLKDTPMTSKDQERFEMALLKGTVSANLPFTWIDNEYVQEAFAIARPEISLPQRGQPEKKHGWWQEQQQAAARHVSNQKASSWTWTHRPQPQNFTWQSMHGWQTLTQSRDKPASFQHTRTLQQPPRTPSATSLHQRCCHCWMTTQSAHASQQTVPCMQCAYWTL